MYFKKNISFKKICLLGLETRNEVKKHISRNTSGLEKLITNNKRRKSRPYLTLQQLVL